MRIILSLMITLIAIATVRAQTNAITENGDSVVLLDNGRWELIENYRLQLSQALAPIPMNSMAFKKSSTAERLTKNMEGHYEVWFDEGQWQETDPKKLNPIAEKAFITKDNAAYGMIIFEPITIELEQLKDVAVDNASRMGKNVKITNQEYRTVNDQKILAIELEGTIQGLDIGYIYYFANTGKGSLQFISFAGKDVFENKKSSLFELLNGLVMKGK